MNSALKSRLKHASRNTAKGKSLIGKTKKLKGKAQRLKKQVKKLK